MMKMRISRKMTDLNDDYIETNLEPLKLKQSPYKEVVEKLIMSGYMDKKEIKPEILDFFERNEYVYISTCFSLRCDCDVTSVYPTKKLKRTLKIVSEDVTNLPSKLKQRSYKEVAEKLIMSGYIDIKEIEPKILDYFEKSDYVHISPCHCGCNVTIIYPTKKLKRTLKIPE